MYERVANREEGIELGRGSAWIRRDGGSSAMAIPFGTFPEAMRHQRL